MTRGFFVRVAGKALVLFLLFDGMQAAVGLPGRLERLSIYRHLVPPLARMDIMRDYPSPVMWRLEPLPRGFGVFRSRLAGGRRHPGAHVGARHGNPGRRLLAYNLSYQTPNPLKDLVVEEHALKREPDAIVWFVTLYDLASDAPPPFRENVHLLLRVNRDDLRALADRFSLSTWETRRLFAAPEPVWRRSILFTGERYRDFALLVARGALDALTPGDPSDTFRPRRPWIGAQPLAPKPLFDESGGGEPAMPNARWGALAAGKALADARGVPLLLVNDPIFRATGPGSEREYNSFYGRRIYDRYRSTLSRYCAAKGIALLDLWDFLRPEEFGDTPQHYLPAANARVAGAVNAELQRIAR